MNKDVLAVITALALLLALFASIPVIVMHDRLSRKLDSIDLKVYQLWSTEQTNLTPSEASNSTKPSPTASSSGKVR